MSFDNLSVYYPFMKLKEKFVGWGCKKKSNEFSVSCLFQNSGSVEKQTGVYMV